MQIYGPSHVHGAHGVNAPHALRGPQGTQRPSATPVDHLDISPAASQASLASDIRADLVARVRGQIADGTYETAEKLDVALERLLDEVG